MRVLGLDLGGTNVKYAVVELDGELRVVAEGQTETRAELGPDAVLARMAELGRQAIATAGPVEAVGVGAPGPLDMDAGRAIVLANLPGWEGRPIVAPLEAALGLPVALLNDARAFTLGELELGAGRGCRDLVGLTVGTGIGGGLVVGGRLHLGLGGTAGELGHLTILPDGPPCPCGNRGCLERLAAGPAIAKAAGTDTPELAVEAARAGGATALAAFEQAGTYLGIGIANVVLALAPERIVVGGGVAAAGDLLLEPARRELARRAQIMPLERISVVPASLGATAGAAGAALWGARRAGMPALS